VNLQSSPTGPAEHWAGGSLCKSWSSWNRGGKKDSIKKKKYISGKTDCMQSVHTVALSK